MTTRRHLQGWKSVRLAEIVSEGPTNGYSPQAGENATGTPTLRLSATTQRHLVLNRETTKRLYEAVPKDSRYWLRPGDLLVQRANTLDLVGATAVFDGPPNTYIYPDLMMRLRFDDEATTKWVWRYLNGPAARRYFKQVAGGAAASMAKISGEKLMALELPLAPLPERKRITDLLDKADAVRRKRKEAVGLKEELLRSAFLEMVGPASRDYSDWPIVTIEELAPHEGAMRTGPFGSDLRHSEFVEKGVAVLGIDNAVKNRFEWAERRFITRDKYEKLKRYTVRAKDVIITIMGTTGRSAVVPDDIPLAITTKHLATLTLDRSLAEPEFVSQSIHLHPEILRQIEQANRGAIMSGLNLGLIRNLRLRLPPPQVQRAFSLVTAQVRSLGERLSDAEVASDHLFNSLIHRAFRGELTAS